MDCSQASYLPEFARTHVHWSSDAISSSATRFSFLLQPFPASGSFPTSRLFASGGQSIGASASASVLPQIGGWGWFQDDSVHYIYCALYFYYYSNSISGHQALDPGGWGPLPLRAFSLTSSLQRRVLSSHVSSSNPKQRNSSLFHLSTSNDSGGKCAYISLLLIFQVNDWVNFLFALPTTQGLKPAGTLSTLECRSDE